MKTAILILDGTTQLVLTPETDWEKNCLHTLGAGEKRAQMFQGSFYGCMGGWHRQARDFGLPYEARSKDDASLIIRVDDPTPPKDHSQ